METRYPFKKNRRGWGGGTLYGMGLSPFFFWAFILAPSAQAGTLFSESFDGGSLSAFIFLSPSGDNDIFEIVTSAGSPAPCAQIDDRGTNSCAVLTRMSVTYSGKEIEISADMRQDNPILTGHRYSTLALAKDQLGVRFCTLTINGDTISGRTPKTMEASLCYNDGGTEKIESSGPRTLTSGDEWHHAMIRVRRDGLVDFYVDGERKYTSSNPLTGAYSGSARVWLGEHKNSFDNVLVKENWLAPSLTGVTPASGASGGGAALTLQGANFKNGIAVAIGGQAATNVSLVSETQLTCTAPALPAGSHTVGVTNSDGQQASLPNAYQSLPPPTLSSLTPTSGPSAGGTTLTLKGSDFRNGIGVTVGGQAASNVSLASNGELTCTTPSMPAGTLEVAVTSQEGQKASLANAFQSIPAPSISSLTPTSGPTAGATSVTIQGANFKSGATVKFGGQAATNVDVQSATKIVCKTPAHDAGAVDVVVTNPDGQSGTSTGGYTYNAPDNTNRAPVVDSGPTSSAAKPLVNDNVDFSVSASDPDGDTLTYTWDFGDGNSGSGAGASHAFTAAGKYSVTVTISDGKTSISSTITQLVYSSTTPTITDGPVATPNPVVVNNKVIFSASASNAAGEKIALSWDFGDGATSADSAPEHTYTSTGLFTATLTATAPDGSTASGQVTVEVTEEGGGGQSSGTMTLTSVKLKLSFAKASSDSLSLMGTMEIPEGFDPEVDGVDVDIGGVLGSFVLDAKGKAKTDESGNANRKFSIKLKFEDDAVVAGTYKFQAIFKKGDFQETWKSKGLLDGNVEGSEMEIPISMETAGKIYADVIKGNYKANEGKSGSFVGGGNFVARGR